jgi:Alcohol dehydrogenase GroES-like domain
MIVLAPVSFPKAPGSRGKFDLTGALTATAGVGALVYGIINSADSGWRAAATVTPILSGAALLTVLVVAEARAAEPVLPLRLLASRVRSGAYLARMLHLGAIAERLDPVIQEPTNAVVRVVRGCVCGSDLWYFRGVNNHAVGSIGHEFIGVVEQVGDGVGNLAPGDFVIAPFTYNDGTCPACQHGFQANCTHGGAFGNGTIDGGQGEIVRVPSAADTLVQVPGSNSANFTDDQLASFTALSGVMCTGYHAAVSAGVKAGDTVAVVGDGAVGLCAVIGSRKLGASRIIALSRNPSR